MKQEMLLFVAFASVLSMILVPLNVFASNGNENGNGNGNGEECECPTDVEVVVNGTDEDGGNQTEDIPDGEIIVIDEPIPTTDQGMNETAEPVENQTSEGNQTGPVITEPEQEPQTEPTAINLALIDSIQRGHNQHVLAFVTDDQGNEFTNETVNIEVVNAKDKLLREFEAGSGQDVTFKVGPNTSPQTLEIKATLESNPDIMATADYYVFPKGDKPTEQPTGNQTQPAPINQTTEPEPLPVNQTQPELFPLPNQTGLNQTFP